MKLNDYFYIGVMNLLDMRNLICFVLLFGYLGLSAQVDPVVELAARSQLEQRGVTEAELRERLLQKGVNLDEISPEQLPALQPMIEQTLSEIEEEKLQQSEGVKSSQAKKADDAKKQEDAKKQAAEEQEEKTEEEQADKQKKAVKTEVEKVATKAGVEVKERIKDGASVEEAVAETLNDQSNKKALPKAPIWGQELFRNKSLEVYRTTKDAKPPESYILGIGDELTVIIFGPSQGDFRYAIDEEGYISPKGMGKIFLKGVPIGKARDLVRARFSRNFLFREDQFIMSLATARTISINIFGEAINSGSFTVSAINTAFNALAAAGGPSDIGSVRKIQLTRNGKSSTLDVYAFMTNPGLQYDFFLENNDVINIPVAEKVVTISGSVNRPFSYELLLNENLEALVKFAAGYQSNAYKSAMQVRRMLGDRPILIDVDLNKTPNFNLVNGDQVFIKAMTESIENFATIEGDIDFPGRYAIEDTPDLGALVQKSGMRRTARKDLAFILRTLTNGSTQAIMVNPDQAVKGAGKSQALLPLDRVIIYKQERYTDIFRVEIQGAVRDAKPQPYNEGMRVSELLLLSGGLHEDATEFGYITRVNLTDNSKEYIRFDAKQALANQGSASDIPLKGLDIVRVFSKKEFRNEARVRVSGAVRKNSDLPYGTNLTLRDALLLSGGLKLEAARGRIDIFRLDLTDNTTVKRLSESVIVDDDMGNTALDILLQPYDEVVVRTVPEFSFQRLVKLEGEVMYPGTYALISPNERISDLIKRAGGLTKEAFLEGGTLYREEEEAGYVITKFEKVIRDEKSQYNLVLKQGDVLSIPKSKDLVSIYTANTQVQDVLPELLIAQGKINVTFESGKRARWYLKEFVGGPDKHSSIKQLRVQYPNGHIRKSLDFGLFAISPKVRPGSKIILQTDLSKIAKTEKRKTKSLDWDKAFTQILTFTSATATLILAIAASTK
jgi:protein involved in polysaccharide export with SLBB domain